jgi:hypothetical protein
VTGTNTQWCLHQGIKICGWYKISLLYVHLLSCKHVGLHPGDRGSMFLWNAGILLQVHMTLKLRRPTSTSSLLREPQISYLLFQIIPFERISLWIYFATCYICWTENVSWQFSTSAKKITVQVQKKELLNFMLHMYSCSIWKKQRWFWIKRDFPKDFIFLSQEVWHCCHDQSSALYYS